MKTKHIAAIIVFILTLFGFWLAGFDFNERGVGAVTCYVSTLALTMLAYAYPDWSDY